MHDFFPDTLTSTTLHKGRVIHSPSFNLHWPGGECTASLSATTVTSRLKFPTLEPVRVHTHAIVIVHATCDRHTTCHRPAIMIVHATYDRHASLAALRA